MLDPQIQTLLDELATLSAGAPPLPMRAPEEIRKADLAFARLCRGNTPVQVVHLVNDASVAGLAGYIPIRIYRPTPDAAPGAMLFFHGGGFMMGDLDSHDDLCRSLCHATGSIVVAVAYRLAPENKFPAAVEDCYAATEWVAANTRLLGYPPGRLVVSGDSAGGNLAANVALMARDRRGPGLCFQLLIYPETSASLDWPSVKEFWEPGRMAAGKGMAFFRSKYFAKTEDALLPYAYPDNSADLSGLPPALIITAEIDPMRDMAESYAHRLKDAGVPVTLSRYDGTTHVFVSMAGRVEVARRALAEAAAAVRAALEA
jgi:acetyl esterase